MQLLKRFPSNGTCDSSAIGGSGVIGFHQWEKGWFMMEYPIWLVVSPPLKNMKVSWDYYSQYMEKSSRPPTINMDDEKMGYPFLMYKDCAYKLIKYIHSAQIAVRA
jgi:hypothetical protein